MSAKSLLPWKQANEIVAEIKKPTIPATLFKVEDYGDIINGEIKDALQAAIDACEKAGGGKVVIPAGRFRSKGSLFLCSNIDLHFSEGCYLKFSTVPNDFLPPVHTRFEGVDINSYSPLIYAHSQSNIKISGRGIIDGGAEVWQSHRAQQGDSLDKLRAFAEEHIPLEDRVFGEGSFLRPSMIQLLHCERILIEDITLLNAPFWMLHPTYSHNITIRNLTFDSMYMNNDGIDIDSCHDVLIEDCSFRNGDDGIVMKSGRDEDGRNVGMNTNNVVIRDCVFPEVFHGFAIGSEMSGGVENIFCYNCDMGLVTGIPLQFKSNQDRGAYMRKVHVENITVAQSLGTSLIYFANDYHGLRHGGHPSVFSDFHLKNITCDFAEVALYFQGVESEPIRDITLENITVTTATTPIGFNENRKNILLENVRINGKEYKDEFLN